MDVTALCTRILINVLMILAADDQHCYCAEEKKADAAFIRLVPNRLQLFEYDSISFDCEGFGDVIEWRVMRRIMGVMTTCGPDWESSRGPCFIKNAFEADSGEYWCEAEGTTSSNSVNISVTAGPVILESPGPPVMEGDDVTLSCRNKKTSSAFITDFYKDGTLVETAYEGNTIIHNVSRSDEGLYKCHIINVGESAESWLAVRARRGEKHLPQPDLPPAVAVCLMALPLLLSVGLCVGWKLRLSLCDSSQRSGPTPCSDETQTETPDINTASAGPSPALYSMITVIPER